MTMKLSLLHAELESFFFFCLQCHIVLSTKSSEEIEVIDGK